ncbi:unnamed protein product [Vitrella brassicaformis CCMP3155]|uniref:AP2/ERF domain-containing protein n=1 Tax=Vitrella brassicaformis (strain CCMP3155) TaxID=1169540 RepID=A0A0G4EQD4_VITBC|nr:unnamed protein product [Vitrella brassicaformis CCMP3155]|eukprot:CEL99840.1 unnamed protein product [Vitrella brassicaformis CCMP3155]
MPPAILPTSEAHRRREGEELSHRPGARRRRDRSGGGKERIVSAKLSEGGGHALAASLVEQAQRQLADSHQDDADSLGLEWRGEEASFVSYRPDGEARHDERVFSVSDVTSSRLILRAFAQAAHHRNAAAGDDAIMVDMRRIKLQPQPTDKHAADRGTSAGAASKGPAHHDGGEADVGGVGGDDDMDWADDVSSRDGQPSRKAGKGKTVIRKSAEHQSAVQGVQWCERGQYCQARWYSKNDGKRENKYFYVKEHGFYKAKALAEQHRLEMERIGLASVRKRCEHQSGVRGVSYNKGGNSWLASWQVGGRKKTKSFSVAELGYEEAKQAAIAHRQKMEQRRHTSEGGATSDEGRSCSPPNDDGAIHSARRHGPPSSRPGVGVMEGGDLAAALVEVLSSDGSCGLCWQDGGFRVRLPSPEGEDGEDRILDVPVVDLSSRSAVIAAFRRAVEELNRLSTVSEGEAAAPLDISWLDDISPHGCNRPQTRHRSSRARPKPMPPPSLSECPSGHPLDNNDLMPPHIQPRRRHRGRSSSRVSERLITDSSSSENELLINRPAAKRHREDAVIDHSPPRKHRRRHAALASSSPSVAEWRPSPNSDKAAKAKGEAKGEAVIRKPAEHQSDVPGVCWSEKYQYWVATWYDKGDGKQKKKYFYVKHHGFDKAKALAEQHRLEMERTGRAAVRGRPQAPQLRDGGVGGGVPLHPTARRDTNRPRPRRDDRFDRHPSPDIEAPSWLREGPPATPPTHHTASRGPRVSPVQQGHLILHFYQQLEALGRAHPDTPLCLRFRSGSALTQLAVEVVLPGTPVQSVPLSAATREAMGAAVDAAWACRQREMDMDGTEDQQPMTHAQRMILCRLYGQVGHNCGAMLAAVPSLSFASVDSFVRRELPAMVGRRDGEDIKEAASRFIKQLQKTNQQNTRLAAMAAATPHKRAVMEQKPCEHQSGVRGVNFDERRKRWVAKWQVGGKTKSKYFSVKELAYEPAKQAAIAHRRAMEERHSTLFGSDRQEGGQCDKSVNRTSSLKHLSRDPSASSSPSAVERRQRPKGGKTAEATKGKTAAIRRRAEHQSKVVGVSWDGKFRAWTASWYPKDGTRQRKKQFTVGEHGFVKAKALAEQHRLEMESTGQAVDRRVKRQKGHRLASAMSERLEAVDAEQLPGGNEPLDIDVTPQPMSRDLADVVPQTQSPLPANGPHTPDVTPDA